MPKQKCPTCGSQVEISHSDEGTACFMPVDWISFKDKLPEFKQDFLGWVDGTIDHYVFNDIKTVWNANSSNLQREDIITGGFLTHWQPLPEPPK